MVGDGIGYIEKTKSVQIAYLWAEIAPSMNPLYIQYARSNTIISVPAKKSYVVSYNANGGTGAPANQTKWIYENLTIPSSTPSRTNYVFKEWNTEPDGSGTSYSPGATYTGNAALTLYAVWYPPYTVTYNSNFGTGENKTQVKVYDQSATLKGQDWFSREGWAVGKWNTEPDGSGTDYALEAAYSSNSDLTLYAVWYRYVDSVTIGDAVAMRVDATYEALDQEEMAEVENPHDEFLYEQVGSGYVRTVDTVVVVGRTYYRAVMGASEVDEGTYIAVLVPVTVRGAASANVSMSATVTADGTSAHALELVRATASKQADQELQVPESAQDMPFVALVHNASTDMRFTIAVTVTAANMSATQDAVTDGRTLIVPTAFFVMDVRAQGHGIAFGAPSLDDTFHVAMPSKFTDDATFLDDVKAGTTLSNARTCYPCFVYSAFPTDSSSNKDESQLPVTPCFVLDTSDMAFYFCDGQ